MPGGDCYRFSLKEEGTADNSDKKSAGRDIKSCDRNTQAESIIKMRINEEDLKGKTTRQKLGKEELI